MPTSAREPLLEISGLSAGYGKIGVLNGIALTVGAGEVVALLGPNGAGKTTLLLAGYGMPARARSTQVEEALAFFPEIAAKRNDRAVTLSGGQQQMLAVAQGLVRRPRLLMLDEPSAGLSPVLVDRVLAAAGRLRDAGTAVLLVEQLIEKALLLADRVYALARGSIVLEAKTGEDNLPDRLQHAYLSGGSRQT